MTQFRGQTQLNYCIVYTLIEQANLADGTGQIEVVDSPGPIHKIRKEEREQVLAKIEVRAFIDSHLSFEDSHLNCSRLFWVSVSSPSNVSC